MEEILLKYFPDLDNKKIEKFSVLLNIFPEWNNKVNLISRKDIENLFEHHIQHSLSIAKVFDFEEGTNIIDVGTGGGFPGIPLAIMFPQVEFDLVDSIGKKISVVSEIAKHLDLSNVRTINSRAELLPPKYDFVISRAVTSFPAFVKISKKLFKNTSGNKEQGIIYLKGGDFIDEIADYKNTKLYNISDFFHEEFFKTKKIIYLRKKSNKIFE